MYGRDKSSVLARVHFYLRRPKRSHLRLSQTRLIYALRLPGVAAF